jgi:hypothetical protein
VDQILALYREHGQIFFHHFFADGSPFKLRFPVPDLKKPGAVAAGALLADGKQQYVVGGGAGFGPLLYMFDENGDLLRKFFAYDPSYQGGLAVAVGDYDADGKDDMIVASQTGGLPVRVWNGNAKLLDEWKMSATKKTPHFTILPVYTNKPPGN